MFYQLLRVQHSCSSTQSYGSEISRRFQGGDFKEILGGISGGIQGEDFKEEISA